MRAPRRCNSAKLVIYGQSDKKTKRISTVSVFDNRTGKHWTPDQIKERGIESFFDLADMKETLNWNLNGDDAKYYSALGQSGKETQGCVAYVFD